MEDLLDRKTYRTLKQMTREEMAKFLNSVYEKGANSVENVQITEEELKQRLAKVKGLGEKRISEILIALSDLYSTTE